MLWWRACLALVRRPMLVLVALALVASALLALSLGDRSTAAPVGWRRGPDGPHPGAQPGHPLPDQRRDRLQVGQAEVDRRVRGRRPAQRLGRQQAGLRADAVRHAHRRRHGQADQDHRVAQQRQGPLRPLGGAGPDPGDRSLRPSDTGPTGSSSRPARSSAAPRASCWRRTRARTAR